MSAEVARGLVWEMTFQVPVRDSRAPGILSHPLKVEIHSSPKAIGTKISGGLERRPFGGVIKLQIDARSSSTNLGIICGFSCPFVHNCRPQPLVSPFTSTLKLFFASIFFSLSLPPQSRARPSVIQLTQYSSAWCPHVPFRPSTQPDGGHVTTTIPPQLETLLWCPFRLLE